MTSNWTSATYFRDVTTHGSGEKLKNWNIAFLNESFLKARQLQWRPKVFKLNLSGIQLYFTCDLVTYLGWKDH